MSEHYYWLAHGEFWMNLTGTLDSFDLDDCRAICQWIMKTRAGSLTGRSP